MKYKAVKILTVLLVLSLVLSVVSCARSGSSKDKRIVAEDTPWYECQKKKLDISIENAIPVLRIKTVLYSVNSVMKQRVIIVTI